MIRSKLPCKLNTWNQPDSDNGVVTAFGVGGCPGDGYKLDAAGRAPTRPGWTRAALDAACETEDPVLL